MFKEKKDATVKLSYFILLSSIHINEYNAFHDGRWLFFVKSDLIIWAPLGNADGSIIIEEIPAKALLFSDCF